MYTLIIKHKASLQTWIALLSIIAGLSLLWLVAPLVIQFFAPQAAMVDASIWQLVLLAFICWLSLLTLSQCLTNYLYKKFILLLRQDLHSPLKTLSLWQQYVLYWALFALLACSATGCLIAIC